MANKKYEDETVKLFGKSPEELRKIAAETKAELERVRQELQEKKAIKKELDSSGEGNKPPFRGPIIFEERETGDKGRDAVKGRYRPPIKKTKKADVTPRYKKGGSVGNSIKTYKHGGYVEGK